MAAAGLLSASVAIVVAASGSSAATITLAKCVLPRAPGATSQAARTQLLTALGVLRRAPQPGDDALPARTYLMFNQEVFVRYIRRARDVGGVSYYVIPALVARCEPAKPYYGVTFRDLEGGVLHASLNNLKKYGVGFSTSSGRSRATFADLVPDGVATVDLHFSSTAAAPAVTIRADVIDNVAVVDIRGPAATAVPTRTTWRATNGTVIKSITSP